MKKFDYLLNNKSIILIAYLVYALPVQAGFWNDDLHIHGFITQGFFHTSDNNLYGQSDDGISPGQTELGLNLSYQALDQLTFSAQGLYRRVGDLDRGSVKLDYAVADLHLFNSENSSMGFRGGRIKIPFGLFNETRDVAVTTPSIILHQGIYFDRSRRLLLSADGGSFYATHHSGWGDLSLKFNIGLPLGDHQEIQKVILGALGEGHFNADPALAAQLNYEINDGEYTFAVSYMDLELDYQPIADDFILPGHTTIKPLLFSFAYNGEKFGLIAEYLYRWNRGINFGSGLDFEVVTESWYVQPSYRILPQLQVYARYGTLSLNIDDREGYNYLNVGLPNHVSFAHDYMLGLRWDFLPGWMVRAEFHHVNGTAWLMHADNPKFSDYHEDWEIFALQLSYQF